MVQLQDLFPITGSMEIKMPDGTPTGVVLKLVGQDSKQFRAVQKKSAQLLMPQNEGEKPTVEQLERAGAELVAACIVGWEGMVDGDEEVPYSEKKALELMMTAELTFIREQVEAYVMKRTNFFRPGTGKA